MKKSLLLPIVSLLFIPSVSMAQDYVPGELIVKYKQVQNQGSKKYGSGQASGGPMGKLISSKRVDVVRDFHRFGMQKLKVKDGSGMNELIREIESDPSVDYAEPNYIINKLSMNQKSNWRVKRADYVSSQSYSASATPSYTQSGASVSAEDAWARSSSLGALPDKPIVAVIDTGVDYTHEVFTLSNAIWNNSGEIAGNGIDDDGNGYIDDIRGWNFNLNNNNPMDDEGHGTHVAGIVLGATQDILADTLEEAKIKIMPLKFLAADGSGSTSDAIEAIHYAVDNGAHILNNSWGGKSYSAALHEALAYTYEKEVLFVAAAGNFGEDNDSAPVYPASFDTPNILSVAASNDWDYLASFSNYGDKTVHVAAPGVGIISSYPGNFYADSSGTSMAAPFAAGVAALAYREALDLTGYQIKELVVNSSDNVSRFQGLLINSVRVNANAAVQLAQSSVGISAYQPGYTLKKVGTESRSVASQGSAGGCGLVQNIYNSAVQNGRSGFSGRGAPPMGLVVVLILAPILILQILRDEKKKSGVDKRRFDRFKIDSQIKVTVGGKELVGNMSTISLGGCSFSAESMLEKGGIITMQIASPDGKEVLEVQGQVVWCSEKKAYGVQFAEMQTSKLQSISQWTKGLMKAN